MAIEWSLVIFSLLAGIGGTLFAYVGLSEFTDSGKAVRLRATLVAIIITLIGGVASVTHLASPQNMMAAAQNLLSFSGISIELILIGITLILMVVYLLIVRNAALATAKKVVAALGIIAGLLLAFFTGHGYVLESQSAWNTETLPIAYLGTALGGGAFLYALLDAIQNQEEKTNKLAIPVSIGGFLGAVTTLIYVVAVGFERAASEALVFWLGLIVFGVVLTAVFALLIALNKNIAGNLGVPIFGLVASVIGALSLRAIMWLLGSGYLMLFDVASGPRIIF
jgi:anaerobic dimethyl sulfoxide reductase subunit C (anchor subunit)